MNRRHFLVLALATPTLAALGCKRAPTRAEVLAALPAQVLVPGARELVTTSSELRDALRKNAHTPSAATLLAAQTRFRAALLAFQRAYALRKGPVVDTNALLRTTFFPAKPTRLAELLASDAKLDAAAIDELGIDVRGLFALEALLFDTSGADASERKRELMGALADNVHDYAERVRRALGDGRALGASWANDAQLTLSQLVNDLLASVEILATERVYAVLAMAQRKRVITREVQGAASGTSTGIVMAWLDGIADVYGSGARGIGSLVAHAAPEIDGRMRTLLEDARKATRAIDGPIEVVAERSPEKLEALHAALKALEVAIKVDLTSALGVTVTFSSADGD